MIFCTAQQRRGNRLVPPRLATILPQVDNQDPKIQLDIHVTPIGAGQVLRLYLAGDHPPWLRRAGVEAESAFGGCSWGAAFEVARIGPHRDDSGSALHTDGPRAHRCPAWGERDFHRGVAVAPAELQRLIWESCSPLFGRVFGEGRAYASGRPGHGACPAGARNANGLLGGFGE